MVDEGLGNCSYVVNLGDGRATVVASRAAGLEHPHRGVAGGETLDRGGLSLEAIETPGRTPEHLAYLLRDGIRPVALFSGGSLLVGAVARTDLIAPDATEGLPGRCGVRSSSGC